MKIGEYQINKWQIIILIPLILGLVIGVYLVQTKQLFKSRASGEDKHFDVYQQDKPGQSVCEGTTCTTKSLDIIIRPIIDTGE